MCTNEYIDFGRCHCQCTLFRKVYKVIHQIETEIQQKYTKSTWFRAKAWQEKVLVSRYEKKHFRSVDFFVRLSCVKINWQNGKMLRAWMEKWKSDMMEKKERYQVKLAQNLTCNYLTHLEITHRATNIHA